MDKQIKTNGHTAPGISMAMGLVDDMEVDKPATNGITNGVNGKRKSSAGNRKSYKEDTDSQDDDVPLVRQHSVLLQHSHLRADG